MKNRSLSKDNQIVFNHLAQARTAAKKAGNHGVAMKIQRVLMQSYQNEAHLLLSKEKGAIRKEIASQGVSDTVPSKFYRSRSGADIKEALGKHIGSGPKPQQTKKIVAAKKDILDDLLAAGPEALLDKSEEELDGLFNSLKIEKQWIRSMGGTVHGKASGDNTRKVTRKILSEVAGEVMDSPKYASTEEE